MEKKDLSDKEMENTAKKTLNYNDRLDGYGFGEADKEEKLDEHEKGLDQEEAEKYGEVDQYTFRERHLGPQHQSNEETKKQIDSKP